jgi:hypothetical protein
MAARPLRYGALLIGIPGVNAVITAVTLRGSSSDPARSQRMQCGDVTTGRVVSVCVLTGFVASRVLR